MTKINFELEQNLLLTRADDYVGLIDTGAPFSVGNPLALSSLGIAQSSKAPTPDLSAVSESLNHPVDAIIGNDRLLRGNVYVDYASRVMELGDASAPDGGYRYLLRMCNGIPATRVVIDGVEVPVIIDTGASMTMVDAELFGNRPIVDKDDGYNPMTGFFSTDIGEVTVRIGRDELEVRAGRLSGGLAQILRSIGIRAILGGNLLTLTNLYLDANGKEARFYP